MFRFLVILVVFLVSVGSVSAQAKPEFKLGFKALASQIPDAAGEAMEDEWHNSVNGDALQRTTKGMMAWRKSDNQTLFTNGHKSWVNGPLGLQSRLNTQRFDWEVPGLSERVEHPKGFAVTVNAVRKAARSADGFSKADSGYIFLIANVTVENVSITSLEFPVYDMYFNLKTADGYKYGDRVVSGLRALKHNLKHGEIARGEVAFHIPENATGLTLTFDPVLGMRDGWSVRIAL